MDLPTFETTRALKTAETSSVAIATPIPSPDLPDEPLFVIEPRKSRLPLDLHEIWAYRELLYFLTWRDLRVRYKQTVLGATWVVMQPLLTTLIFTIVLGKLARV